MNDRDAHPAEPSPPVNAPTSNRTAKPQPERHELRLTVALQRVLQQVGKPGEMQSGGIANAQPLTMGLVIDATGERAFGVVMAFLCLPFLTPLTLPGVSVPFGLALLLLGAQLAIRMHRPWLPSRLMRWHLPPKMGPLLIAFVAKIFKPLERIIRPRLLFMQNRVAMVAVGLALMVDGFLLSLPMPPVVPLTNTIPAWMALIKILGITEEDGISLLAGTVLTASAVVALVILVVMSWSKAVAWWG